MSKKLKITEEQLKRLVENKNRQIKENEELNEIGLGLIEWGTAKMIAPKVIEYLKEDSHDLSYFNVRWFTKALEQELNTLMENNVHDEKEGRMEEEIDESSKEEYFAKHGEDSMGWTGSSNKTYQDLPDGDYDDESYDDFDTLHKAYPNFHSHYSGKGEVDRARGMFDTYKNNRGPLRIKKRRPMDEMGMKEDDMMNESVKGYKTEFERFLKSPKQ